MKTLVVWFDQARVGELHLDDSGRLSFGYDGAFVGNPNTLPISISLPKQLEPFDEGACRPFFDGLLPEAKQRSGAARALGVTEGNTFSLLDRLGGEVAGALAFLSPGAPPKPLLPVSQSVPLGDAELGRILEELPRRPLLAGQQGLRLSLAGAQSKLPVCLVDGQVCLPAEDQPTTHILKPSIPEFPASTENEAFCMRLASELGLPVAKAEARVLDVGGRPTTLLLVERYDRVWKDGKTFRLHQEDFCQALGVPSIQKYQSEGGPNFKACFDLVRRVSVRPSVDLNHLLDMAIVNVLMGNADAHGKNFSLLYAPDGIRLAPFYDLMCTAYYPALAPAFAMKIGDQSEFERMRILAWKTFASHAGLTFPYVRKRIQELASLIPGASNRALESLANQGLDEAALAGLASLVTRRSEQTLQRMARTEPD